MIIKQIFIFFLVTVSIGFQLHSSDFVYATSSTDTASVKVVQHDLNIRFTDYKMPSGYVSGAPTLSANDATQLFPWASVTFVRDRYVIDNPTSRTVILQAQLSPVAEASVQTYDLDGYPENTRTFIFSGSNSFQWLRINVGGSIAAPRVNWKRVQTKTAGSDIESYYRYHGLADGEYQKDIASWSLLIPNRDTPVVVYMPEYSYKIRLLPNVKTEVVLSYQAPTKALDWGTQSFAYMPSTFDGVTSIGSTKVHIESPAHLFVALEDENLTNKDFIDIDGTYPKERAGTYFVWGFRVAKDRVFSTVDLPLIMMVRDWTANIDPADIVCTSSKKIMSFRNTGDRKSNVYFERIVGDYHYMIEANSSWKLTRKSTLLPTGSICERHIPSESN